MVSLAKGMRFCFLVVLFAVSLPVNSKDKRCREMAMVSAEQAYDRGSAQKQASELGFRNKRAWRILEITYLGLHDKLLVSRLRQKYIAQDIMSFESLSLDSVTQAELVAGFYYAARMTPDFLNKII